MARPKSSVPTSKTYMQRFTSFRNEHCPYCGADGATLEPNRRGYHGQCMNPKCNAQGNFTNPRCREMMEK